MTTLIDAMARALWLEDARHYERLAVASGRAGINEAMRPEWYDNFAAHPASGHEFRKQWEGLARAALQAMLDNGPTQRMVDAGWKESWRLQDADTSCTPRDLFRAMIRAELDGGHVEQRDP